MRNSFLLRSKGYLGTTSHCSFPPDVALLLFATSGSPALSGEQIVESTFRVGNHRLPILDTAFGKFQIYHFVEGRAQPIIKTLGIDKNQRFVGKA